MPGNGNEYVRVYGAASSRRLKTTFNIMEWMLFYGQIGHPRTVPVGTPVGDLIRHTPIRVAGGMFEGEYPCLEALHMAVYVRLKGRSATMRSITFQPERRGLSGSTRQDVETKENLVSPQPKPAVSAPSPSSDLEDESPVPDDPSTGGAKSARQKSPNPVTVSKGKVKSLPPTPPLSTPLELPVEPLTSSEATSQATSMAGAGQHSTTKPPPPSGRLEVSENRDQAARTPERSSAHIPTPAKTATTPPTDVQSSQLNPTGNDEQRAATAHSVAIPKFIERSPVYHFYIKNPDKDAADSSIHLATFPSIPSYLTLTVRLADAIRSKLDWRDSAMCGGSNALRIRGRDVSLWDWLDQEFSSLREAPPPTPIEKRIDLYCTAFESRPKEEAPPLQVAPEERRSYGIPTSEFEYDATDSETRSPSPSALSELSRVPTETYIDDLVSNPYNSPASTHLLRIIQDEGVAPASSLGLALLSLVKQLQIGGQYNPIVVEDSDANSTTGITEGVKAALDPVHDRLNDFAAMLNTIAEAVGVDLLENDDDIAADPFADADPFAWRPIGSQVTQPVLSREGAQSSPTLVSPLAADLRQIIHRSLPRNSGTSECVETTATVATDGSGPPATSPLERSPLLPAMAKSLGDAKAELPRMPGAPRAEERGASQVDCKKEPSDEEADVVETVDRPSLVEGNGRDEQDGPRPCAERNMFVKTDISKTETLDGGEAGENAEGPSKGKESSGQDRSRRRAERNMFVNDAIYNDVLPNETSDLTSGDLYPSLSPSCLASPTAKAANDETPMVPLNPCDSPKTARERLQEILEEAEKLAPEDPGRRGMGPSTRTSVHWPEEALETNRAVFNRPSAPTNLSNASRTVNIHALIPRGPESVSSDGDDALPSTASTIHVSPFSEPGPQAYRPWWMDHGIPRPGPFEPPAMPLFGPGAYAMGYAPIFHDQPPIGSPPWGSADPRPGMFAHMPAYPGMHNRWFPTWRWHVPNGHPVTYGPAAQGGWGGQSSGLHWD